MAHLALDHALPASWIDEVFQAHRQRQYPRELLFSSVVELMLLVTLGLRPSLHAAARKMADRLPVSLAALYAKVQRTEPAVLRALVQGSAERLVSVSGCLPERHSLPGWQLRVFDGNHLPASQKRLGPLRGFRGAALPGHTLVVYDPDSALVCDIVACEDAHQSERTGAAALIERAQPQQVWIGDRHFCTQAILLGLAERGAGFIVREHARHPRLRASGPWSPSTDIDTGQVRKQVIELAEPHEGLSPPWRRIEIALHTPTDAGDRTIVLWSNLPAQIDAPTLARLYRQRWRIEGMFGRLESVLNSEIKTLGHPRAALLGCKRSANPSFRAVMKLRTSCLGNRRTGRGGYGSTACAAVHGAGGGLPCFGPEGQGLGRGQRRAAGNAGQLVRALPALAGQA